MSNNNTQSPLQPYSRILDFWHKVEFFIPYDLETQILDHNDKEWAVRSITEKHLSSLAPRECGDLWQVARIPFGKRLYGFDLFLGIFDKALLSQIVQETMRHR